MIKNFLMQAKTSIENEKQNAINTAKDKVTREQIIPHNQEIDKARDAAIAELTTAYNAKVKALQDELTANKQTLIEKGETEKKNFANTSIEVATIEVSKKYDDNIALLTEQIKNIEE